MTTPPSAGGDQTPGSVRSIDTITPKSLMNSANVSPGVVAAAAGAPTSTLASGHKMPSTPPAPGSPSNDDPVYSALGDALWGGWRNFRDAVRDEAVNAALELEKEGKDIRDLLRQVRVTSEGSSPLEASI